MIVDVGYAAPEQVRRDLEHVLYKAAQDQSTVTAYRIDSGSAASMAPVTLPRDGKLELRGGNDDFRDAEAKSLARQYAQVIAPSAPAVDSATGRDLLGALRRALREVAGSPVPTTVVLLTGGGVHRTAALDLINPPLTIDRVAAAVASAGSIDVPSNTVVEIIGAGRFEGSSTPIAPEFAEAIPSFWTGVCPACSLS